MNLRRALFAAFIAASVVVTACGGAGSGGTKPAVTVGSTNFYEQLTLGELYSQILEANGYTVTRKFNLGNREIVEPAIESGLRRQGRQGRQADHRSEGDPDRASKSTRSEGPHRPRLRGGDRSERLRRDKGHSQCEEPEEAQ